MQYTYAQRIKFSTNPTAIKLLKIIEDKQSNLSLSLDVTKKKDFLRIADELGPKICVLKTHIDIVEDFDADLIERLVKLAEKHNFIIFEDRKFADIGNTVALQYGKGIYRISDWAPITNAHVVPGEGIIAGLKQVGLPKGNALLLLAEMSAKGNLAKGSYTQAAIDMAKANKDFVIGFISRKKLIDDPAFLHFIPGVKIEEGGDQLGQDYLTPERAIVELGNDIIIVGRGIYESTDPLIEAEKYRQIGWEAYQGRIKA